MIHAAILHRMLGFFPWNMRDALPPCREELIDRSGQLPLSSWNASSVLQLWFPPFKQNSRQGPGYLRLRGLTTKGDELPAINLSKINFQALANRFKQSKHKNSDLEALKTAIRGKLEQMVRLNPTRTDFAEKFEALIESYNSGNSYSGGECDFSDLQEAIRRGMHPNSD